MVSETIAELLAVKIRRLPHQVQGCLKIASLLGFRFREDLLALVMTSYDDRTSRVYTWQVPFFLRKQYLRPCLRPSPRVLSRRRKWDISSVTTNSKLLSSRWLALRKMFDFIWRLGKHFSLWGDLNRCIMQPSFASCTRVVTSEAKRVELATANLEAAKYCKEKSAFVEAGLIATERTCIA